MRLCAMLVLIVSGCSFVFARGTPDPREPGGRDCASESGHEHAQLPYVARCL